ncbi:MAG: AAA family ATPase [Rectinemataceae bacterium]|nr:AAA family ATPase [Rectinemataceae bacterium]
MVQGRDLLFIDEAQRVPDIVLNLKILHDGIPNLRIIATGSSSFELAQKTGESLTGRTRSMTLLPLSVVEWASTLTPFELSRKRDEFMIFGMYPGLIGFPDPTERAEALAELADNYLYKDILSLGGIRNERKIRDLVRLLAFQTGCEVSFTLFRSRGYSANLRNEITKKDKVYIAERRKLHLHAHARVDSRFWRTHAGSEIDLIEESGGGGLGAWKIKSGQKSAKVPPAWAAAYPKAPFHVINEGKWLPF